MTVIQTKIIHFNLRNQSSAEHFKKKENETKSEWQWFFTQLSHILKVIEYYAIVFLHCSHVFFWSHSPCTEWWLQLLGIPHFNRFLIESSVFTPMIFCKYKCQTSPVVAISLCQVGKWKFNAFSFWLALTEHATTTQEWKLLVNEH